MKRIAMVALALAALIGLAGVTPGAIAQDVVKQVKLSEKVVEGFINAQKDMAAMAEKLQKAPPDKPDPKLQAELDGIAKKHGFKDFMEYDDIAANISMVMAGLDPQSGAFTDPITAIKKEIEEVKADKSIAEKDKKQMLEELNEALRTTEPIKFPENIEVVKKYREKIDAVLQ
jgi:hypothetical protein